MEKDTGIPLSALNADGGASRDKFLMQFQADILNKRWRRPVIRETTALGAALLAGLATGVWSSQEEVKSRMKTDSLYEPAMDEPSGKSCSGPGTKRWAAVWTGPSRRNKNTEATF